MRIWNITAAALLVFAVGCNKSTTGGTSGSGGVAGVGGSKEGFSFTLPPASQDVKQGETRLVEGTLNRGSEFKKDIKLKAESNDKKVDVKVVKDTIKASEPGDSKFSIEVKAEKDAPVAVIEVKVTGTPDGGGPDAVGTFKVNVTK